MEHPGYDYSELQGAIKRVFGVQSAFAKAMNMAESTLSLKLNNKAEWSQEEMFLAVELLGDDSSKIKPYFLRIIFRKLNISDTLQLSLIITY